MSRREIFRVGQGDGAADAGCIGKPADAAGAEGMRRIAPQPLPARAPTPAPAPPG
jgi:hypothetical protein